MKLAITRQKGFYGKFRRLKLFVDEEEVGSLREGETVGLDIPLEARILEGGMDWGRTLPIDLMQVSDGDEITFKPRFSFNLSKSLGIDALPFEITISRPDE